MVTKDQVTAKQKENFQTFESVPDITQAGHGGLCGGMGLLNVDDKQALS